MATKKMAVKKIAAKKMIAKKLAVSAKKASPVKQALPAGAEITGKYNERVTRGLRNFSAQGSNFGTEAGVSIGGDLQATAKPFAREYVTEGKYTSVYGANADGKKERLFRGQTGMGDTDKFITESKKKEGEVNSRRNKNANTYNAMQGPVSNLSNPQVLESAVKLGNVKVNPRTGQTPAKMIVKKKVSPAKQMSPMDKKPMAKKDTKTGEYKKAAPVKMKKC
jgi:hypothetical protein